jgi:hypothetical protein
MPKGRDTQYAISSVEEVKPNIFVRMGADKSLPSPISLFPTCSTIKRIFLSWVKEVKTTNSCLELKGDM